MVQETTGRGERQVSEEQTYYYGEPMELQQIIDKILYRLDAVELVVEDNT